MKANEKDFMEGRIEKLLKRMNYEQGKKVLVFLDTGAIIDAEEELAKYKLYNSGAQIEKIYNSLLGRGLNLFVISPVFGEVLSHHNCNKVNGRAEISKQNFEIVSNLQSAYENFLQNIKNNDKDEIDAVRRDVYWASVFAFEEDKKKGERDPISHVDRELISSAAWARYAHVPFYSKNANGGIETVVQKPDEVIVLSPDSHVEKTITMMSINQLGLNYEGIRTVSSR